MHPRRSKIAKFYLLAGFLISIYGALFRTVQDSQFDGTKMEKFEKKFENFRPIRELDFLFTCRVPTGCSVEPA